MLLSTADRYTGLLYIVIYIRAIYLKHAKLEDGRYFISPIKRFAPGHAIILIIMEIRL